jgi:AhpD family alkylhydroperoxidase
MIADFELLADEVDQSSADLTGGVPDAMKGFKALGRAAYADGALTRRTKELIALALSIASRCDGCVAYHARRLSDLGAGREEVLETIAVAVQMGGGPSMVYGGEALRAFDSFCLPVLAE